MIIEKVSTHLDKAFDSFIALFEKDAQEILMDKSYFAGGCIYCLANDKPIKDYDLFLFDVEDCARLENLKLWKCKTEYALSRGLYQLVTKYHGPPEECVGQFDFKHNMYFYRPYSGEVGTACGEFNSLYTNTLIFNERRARDIEGVCLRINRFIKRGFIAPPEMIAEVKKRTSPGAVNAYAKKLRENRYIDSY